jgi:hypothetical protein
MRAFWLSLLSIALLASCATGAGDEEDGVIKGRADARADGGAIEDDTATEEDTATESDTSVEPIDATSGDSAAADTYVADTGTADSGTADTGSADTGPTPCTGEEAEPNDTTATARTLGTIDDCDGSGKSVSGVLSTSSDVDVLTFDGTDSFGCSVNPTVTATGPVRVCIKATCKSGTTEFKSCPKGTPTGTECCGTTVELELNCTGTTSDDAKIAITVRGDGSSLTCAGYSLAYHY